MVYRITLRYCEYADMEGIILSACYWCGKPVDYMTGIMVLLEDGTLPKTKWFHTFCCGAKLQGGSETLEFLIDRWKEFEEDDLKKARFCKLYPFEASRLIDYYKDHDTEKDG